MSLLSLRGAAWWAVLSGLLLAAPLSLAAQDSTYRIRVMHYNLLNFGINLNDCTFDVQRYQELEVILNHYQPHLFTVNEIGLSTLYPTNVLRECFTYPNQMARTSSTNQAGGDRTNHLFYDESLFGLISQSVIPSRNLRDINLYELYLKPSVALGDTVYLSCLVAHLKAGDSSSDVAQRDEATQDIMSWVATEGQGKNLLLLGDLNLNNSAEVSFQNLIAPANAALAWRDPVGVPSGWSGQAFAGIHTQSTRSSGSGCFAGGGLDDRFDFILSSASVLDSSLGLAYQAGSYQALGNAGNSYNAELLCGSGNSSLPTPVCVALRNMSDHLPVVMTLAVEGPAVTALPLATQLGLRLGPNPVGDQVALILSAPAAMTATLRLEICDATGRPLLRRPWPARQARLVLDSHAWPAGLYLLRLVAPDGSRLQRKLLKS